MGGDGDSADNLIGGDAENVVQAGHVHGGVHFHQATPPEKRPESPPRQVPSPTQLFVNNRPQLDTITDFLQPGQHTDGQPARTVVVQSRAGGAGKSQTVYQWIQEHGEHYPDGHFYVRLTGDDPGQVSAALQQMLLAAGFSPETIPATLDGRSSAFRDWSAGKRIAVVIDDAITPSQVRSLMPGKGGSVLLVTEARDLGILQAEGAKFVMLDPLSAEAARELIFSIAGQTRDLTAEPGVDELIKLCEGCTLALCVVGAILANNPARSVSRVVRDLSNRRLTTLSRNKDASVRAAFDTALDPLNAQDHQVYRAFGWHPGNGDVSLNALLAVTGLDADELVDALERLREAKLIHEPVEDRYLAYGLVREHARERFPDAGELEARFERYYLDHAIPAGHAILPGRGWLEKLGLRLEWMNPDAAWEWLSNEEDALRAVAKGLYAAGSMELCTLAVALWPFQEKAKHADDMDTLNSCAAEVAEHHGADFAAGLAIVQRSFALRTRGEYDKAAELLAAAEQRAVAADSAELAATAVETRGIVLRDHGDRDAATEALRRNVELAEELLAAELPDERALRLRRLALARMHLGSVAEPAEAIDLLTEARKEFQDRGEAYNAAKCRMWRGKRHTDAGGYAVSETELTAALAEMTEHGQPFDRAQTLRFLGENAVAAGNPVRAREYFLESVEICRTRAFPELEQLVRALLETTQA